MGGSSFGLAANDEDTWAKDSSKRLPWEYGRSPHVLYKPICEQQQCCQLLVRAVDCIFEVRARCPAIALISFRLVSARILTSVAHLGGPYRFSRGSVQTQLQDKSVSPFLRAKQAALISRIVLSII